MVQIKLKIKGIDSTREFLKKQNINKLRQVENAMTQVALFMEGEVKQSIAGQKAEPRSVDTGRFLNSVQGRNPFPLSAKISSNVPYSKHLEYGTTRIKARRHFRNSLERNRTKIIRFVKDKLKTK